MSNDLYGNETHRFDNLVLPKLSLALQSSAKKKAIFIHLMGSHLKYDKRYPEEFKQFSDGPYYSYSSAPTSTQKNFLNSYDNTILFSDTIINTAIKKLSDQAKESAGLYSLTYISDHGEEVFNSIDFKGHRPNNITPAMVEIPFITWFSDQYLQTNTKKIETLKDNRSQPAMLDQFFHYALSLMSIDSDIINARKNLFSNQYQPRERIVYGRNYDKVIKSDAPLKKAD
ncbi:sulfatase-like hydrolase/transferase [Amphritea sp. 1_MG-2023]|nr:sulfatase-like hydrolase/transferase [Amphritea sp. 1_MG-2023]MDO6564102.1 sulfatase-like hydrolase/transferase [Amphritea sp. 1_MG-2023]